MGILIDEVRSDSLSIERGEICLFTPLIFFDPRFERASICYFARCSSFLICLSLMIAWSASDLNQEHFSSKSLNWFKLDLQKSWIWLISVMCFLHCSSSSSRSCLTLRSTSSLLLFSSCAIWDSRSSSFFFISTWSSSLS